MNLPQSSSRISVPTSPHAQKNTRELPSPGSLKALFSLSESASQQIADSRARILRRITEGKGAPIAIVGPCSIHCETAALEYAERLSLLQKRLGHSVQIVMRAYFEKPRTTVGWKGFLYDPDLDGSDNLALGLARGRKLLVQLSEMGMPLATEILDPLSAPFFDDCLSWVAIGARTSESQIHRQLASGLPCAVGFKNGTDGSVEVAAQGIVTALASHSHLGIDDHGRLALTRTAGNDGCHVVLRGGQSGPNFEMKKIAEVGTRLEQMGLAPRVLVDCSHQNSGKDHRNQPQVARTVFQQLGQAHADVIGVMIESHLVAGRQEPENPKVYGMSVTDACIDFNTTEHLLEELAEHARRLNLE